MVDDCPEISYRETVRRTAENVEGRHVRQTSGPGQYGVVYVNLEPAPGVGVEFIDRTDPERLPRDMVGAVEAGVREALQSGVLAGHPMVDVRVTLVDAKFHEVDSTERAFEIAASQAVREAAKRARPVLLEPVCAVEVVTPEEYLGDVIGDLNRRRGRVHGIEPRGDGQVVTARVPLSEMCHYATHVRAMTDGRASHSISDCTYEEVPPA